MQRLHLWTHIDPGIRWQLLHRKINMKYALTLVSLLLATPLSAGDILIEDAYARSSRPGAPTGAAFMVIRNTGSADDRLIGAESGAAKLVELHTHIEEDGVMKMRPVEEGFAVPAGETHELARGGDHVMLMGLVTPLEDGGSVEIKLIFETAGEMEITVPVDLSRGQMQHGKMKSDG